MDFICSLREREKGALKTAMRCLNQGAPHHESRPLRYGTNVDQPEKLREEI